jgi:hypothetical protein
MYQGFDKSFTVSIIMAHEKLYKESVLNSCRKWGQRIVAKLKEKQLVNFSFF